jgi:hypothetical protein
MFVHLCSDDLQCHPRCGCDCCCCRRTIMDDPFIRQYVEDLLRKIRTQVRHASGC